MLIRQFYLSKTKCENKSRFFAILHLLFIQNAATNFKSYKGYYLNKKV